MRRFLLMSAILVLMASASVLCQKRPFGLGAIAGEPLGGTMKVWFGRYFTFDLAAGADFGVVGQRLFDYETPPAFQIHADLCGHATFIRPGTARMPLYIGAGPQWRIRRGGYFRVRTPIGFALLLPEPPFPWEIFMEFVPTWGVRPYTFDPDLAAGARYYF